MKSIVEYPNYRDFLSSYIKSLPNQGYGKMSEVARYIGVHTTLISQVIKGHKDLSSDQAILVSEFFGLSELETDYLIQLINRDRAGNQSAIKFYNSKLNELKKQFSDISKRVTKDVNLSEEQRAIFYSDWTYSAVRQSAALPRINNIKSISIFLNLPIAKVRDCINFLVKAGLCIETNEGLSVGLASTHIERTSPWAKVHHSNWRQKAIQSLSNDNQQNLHYTAPLTISLKDSERVREKLIQLVQEVRDIVDPSPSEDSFCLNLDWFKISAKEASEKT